MHEDNEVKFVKTDIKIEHEDDLLTKEELSKVGAGGRFRARVYMNVGAKPLGVDEESELENIAWTDWCWTILGATVAGLELAAAELRLLDPSYRYVAEGGLPLIGRVG